MSAPAAVDLLDQAIARARPVLQNGTTKERVRLLWVMAKNARGLATEDQIEAEFLKPAVAVGLINERGYWTGEDVRRSIRRYGPEDILHALRWAARGRNPFERAR